MDSIILAACMIAGAVSAGVVAHLIQKNQAKHAQIYSELVSCRMKISVLQLEKSRYPRTADDGTMEISADCIVDPYNMTVRLYGTTYYALPEGTPINELRAALEQELE